MHVLENISLKSYNTFHIDVATRFLTQASSVDDLKEIISEKRFENVSKLILGGGSNILFTKNFNGVIIKNELKGIEVVDETDSTIKIKSAAGEVWHQLVLWCVKNNYGGIENLSLIPGCVGAGPMQNIGAYGVELKDTFFELEALQIENCQLQTFNLDECKFGYRNSIFKNEAKGKYIITSVTFQLKKNPKTFNTSYGAIESELKKMNVSEINIQNISQAVINIRRSKLPDPDVIGNAGSFFKNPEIEKAKFEKLKTDFSNIVGYNVASGNVKLAAGWLIEQCGWKGKVVGNTGSHKDQSLVLVNYGNAKGDEVLQLAKDIQQSVKDKFDVELEMEVNVAP